MIRIRAKICVVLTAAAVITAAACASHDTEKISALRNEEFIFEIENDEVAITGLNMSSPSVIEIPSEIDGLPVTEIRKLFGIEDEVIIPDTVTKIGAGAFASSYYLSRIVVPESVTEIGEQAFKGCPKLEYCEIRGGISEISGSMFMDCPKLETLIYPESITQIGGMAFSGCSSLTQVYIPTCMTKIYSYTFKDCSSLTEIDIPDNTTYIGEGAFDGCSSVRSLEVPDTVDSLSDRTFNGCSSLEYLKLPQQAVNNEDSDTGDCLFKNCRSLKNIVLPYGISNLGQSSFEGCENLTNIILPDTVHTIDRAAFKDCSRLSFIDLPENLVVYGKELFSGCTSLKELTVPDITGEFGGEYMFRNCTSLERIVIPSAVDYNANPIDVNSFEGCVNLKELVYMGMKSSFGGKYLGYIHDTQTDTYSKNEDLTIYCRAGSNIEKYAQNNGLNYSIVDGSEAYAAYVSAYYYIKGETTEIVSDPSDISRDHYTAFIYKDGDYNVALRFGYFTILDNKTDIAVCTGVSAEKYPEFKAAPLFVKMNGVDLTELYEDASYDVDQIDGIYYLYLHFESVDDIIAKNLTADIINVGFEVSGITDEAHDPEYLRGDLDMNGTINCSDFIILKQYLLGMRKLSELQLLVGDINEEGRVNVIDMIYMKNYFLNI